MKLDEGKQRERGRAGVEGEGERESERVRERERERGKEGGRESSRGERERVVEVDRISLLFSCLLPTLFPSSSPTPSPSYALLPVPPPSPSPPDEHHVVRHVDVADHHPLGV